MQTQDIAGGEWIYHKLYVGQALDKMDRLLIEVVRQISQIRGDDGFFVLRYIDEAGPHLRVRVNAKDSQTEPLAEQLGRLYKKLLIGISQLPASTYNPLISGFDTDAFTVDRYTSEYACIRDRYQPEYDKFGGERGIAIAERLFCASSAIAAEILAHDEGAKYSRKTIAPYLMDAVYNALGPQESPETFWKEYATYWMRGDTPAADDWRARFDEKADELARQGISVVGEAAALPDLAREQLQFWKDALNAAVREYDAQGILNKEVSGGALCFQFAHLMNNRLGFFALEESYLGYLISNAYRRLSK